MPEAVEALNKAIEGLSYQSESDEPFKVVDGGAVPITPANAVKLSGQRAGAKVLEVPLDQFFSDLTQDQDWHGAAEKEMVAKYRTLLKTIQAHLSDAKVFKVGEVNLDVLVLGKTNKGQTTGVKTKAVET